LSLKETKCDFLFLQNTFLGISGIAVYPEKEIHGNSRIKQEMDFWVFSGKNTENTEIQGLDFGLTQKFKNHYYFVMKLSYAESSSENDILKTCNVLL
jgi:hypothetical protein